MAVKPFVQIKCGGSLGYFLVARLLRNHGVLVKRRRRKKGYSFYIEVRRLKGKNSALIQIRQINGVVIRTVNTGEHVLTSSPAISEELVRFYTF